MHGISFFESTATDLSFAKAKGQLRLCLRLKGSPVGEFSLNEGSVNRIQAEVMLENEISKKVLLKNGFLKEGVLRQATMWSGKGIVDLEIYSILKEEYLK